MIDVIVLTIFTFVIWIGNNNMQGFILQANETVSFHLKLLFIGNIDPDSLRHLRDSKGYYNMLYFSLFCFFIVYARSLF